MPDFYSGTLEESIGSDQRKGTARNIVMSTSMPQTKKHTVVKSLKGMPERRLELRTYALRMRLSNSKFPLIFSALCLPRGAQKSLIGRRNVLISAVSSVLVPQQFGPFLFRLGLLKVQTGCAANRPCRFEIIRSFSRSTV